MLMNRFHFLLLMTVLSRIPLYHALSVSPSAVISSKSSTTIKLLKGLLTSRKKRSSAGMTVVEGPRSVLDLCQQRPQLIDKVLISQSEWPTLAPAVQTVLQKSQHEIQLLQVTKPVLDSLTDTVTPQGIMALVKIPTQTTNTRSYNNRNDLHPLTIVLDGLADPGNVGTLLRSAVAVGVTQVILLPGTADPWAPKTLRSSMGAAFGLTLTSYDTWQDAYKELQNNYMGIRIYAATMDEHNIPSSPYYAVTWHTQSTALVVGNEGNGLSNDIRKALQQKHIQAVHVPMLPQSVESLNAGVCASVIMFEYLRQIQTTSSNQ